MTARVAMAQPSPSPPTQWERAGERGSRPGRAAGGFTLLEVMIALAILAASLVLVSEIAGGALRNHLRARQLETATLLARTKMVQVQADAERKGFRDFDESDEGTFEREGHPEVRWKVELRKPTVELGPKAVLGALTGGKTLEELLPTADTAPALAPFLTIAQGQIQMMLTQIGEQLKKSLREVRLTVSWTDGAATESFDVVTHLVVLQPEEH